MLITAPALASTAGIRHAFFTRLGGVSAGLYASLNCGLGSADDPACVQENRVRAMAVLCPAQPAPLMTAHQVHSARAVVVEAPVPAAATPQADGLVTRTRGMALGILTADCAPVLFADADAGVIGAAHAGWRGAKAGIVEATLTAMESLGAALERIVAAVGPTIGPQSYEVGAEFRSAFTAGDAAAETLFAPADRPHHYRFDLPAYVGRRLAARGIHTFAVIDSDTYADDRFFSFRRATHAGAGDYGRQLSAIVLEP
ncbi:MAG: peptidoglycan editing factor PgeF [Defluviicoccus sp.]